MKTVRTLVFLSIAAVLSACGSNFEWFPKVTDTFPPGVTASIAGNTIFSNRTTHVSALPASVTFVSDEAATIYYTTNGSTPTTASASVSAGKDISVAGPTITVTSTILKFFGIDTLSNPSTVQTSTIVSP